MLPDGTTRLSLAGKPVYQYGHVGTYASRTVVAESSAIPIRPDMPLDRAALIGCSVMTGVGAVINTAQVPPGASMAVFGVGGVGLNVIQGGALVTAHPIVAVDVRAERLEQARALGATHVVDASRQDPVAAIRAITRRGADYTFAAVGDVRAMGQTIDALAPGGTAVMIGVPGDRGDGAAQHAARGEPGARHSRLDLRERPDPRGLPAPGGALHGGEAPPGRPDHAPLLDRRGGARDSRTSRPARWRAA